MNTALIAGISALIGAIGVALVNIIKAAYGRNQNKKDQQQHEENLIKLSSSITNVNQVISELRGEIMSVLNEMSKDLDRVDRKLEDFHSEWKDYNIVMLRHDITSVYEHYKDAAAMPKVIYESTMNLYDKYSSLGGNSYVHDIIEEMRQWEKI